MCPSNIGGRIAEPPTATPAVHTNVTARRPSVTVGAGARNGRVIGSTFYEDIERGEFVSEELELRGVEVGDEFTDEALFREAAPDFEEEA